MLLTVYLWGNVEDTMLVLSFIYCTNTLLCLELTYLCQGSISGQWHGRQTPYPLCYCSDPRYLISYRDFFWPRVSWDTKDFRRNILVWIKQTNVLQLLLTMHWSTSEQLAGRNTATHILILILNYSNELHSLKSDLLMLAGKKCNSPIQRDVKLNSLIDFIFFPQGNQDS